MNAPAPSPSERQFLVLSVHSLEIVVKKVPVAKSISLNWEPLSWSFFPVPFFLPTITSEINHLYLCPNFRLCSH